MYLILNVIRMIIHFGADFMVNVKCDRYLID